MIALIPAEDYEISLAERNYVELPDSNDENASSMPEWRGGMARKLLNSPDFHPTQFVFAVWEVTDNTYDHQTDASKHACIHRANQSTLEEALKYMKNENYVLVHDKTYKEPLN